MNQPIRSDDEDLTQYVTRVRFLRKRAGLTMLQLAARSNVSQGVIQRMETPEEDYDIEGIGVGQFRKVAAVLKTTACSIYPALKTLQPTPDGDN